MLQFVHIMTILTTSNINSPIGKLTLIYDNQKLCALEYPEYHDRMSQLLKKRYGDFTLEKAAPSNIITEKLQKYFLGDITSIIDISTSISGTSFQQEVWKSLQNIPAGTTSNYKEIAVNIKKPHAARAVGYANSLNPIAIVIPCHRVISANGKINGYAGGTERKKWLLQHEHEHKLLDS